MKKILFLANLPTSNSNSLGGATVLAKNILNYIKTDNSLLIEHIPLRKNWFKYGQIIDYFLWVFKAPFIFKKYDIISIHATSDFHFTIAPIVWFWAKLLNKKIIYHFFGGIFYEKYNSKPKWYKYIIKNSFLKSDKLFVETKSMLNKLQKEVESKIVWLPNSRKPNLKFKTNPTFDKKFVFISRVTPTKGINEIILASKNLPKDYTIDIYGPLDSKFYTSAYFDKYNVTYKGVLKSNNVIKTLSNYNILLLPTYHAGEGYPGIIIESLSLGIPVITTNWRSIPEIIQHDYNGILIDIQDSNSLQNAIVNFNSDLYKKYSKQALLSFKTFSDNFVFNKVLKVYKML